MMAGTYTGIIDRVVQDRWVVFEISEDGEWVAEINTEVENLPEGYRYSGAQFDVEVADGELVDMHPRPDKQRARHERIQDLEERTRRNDTNDE